MTDNAVATANRNKALIALGVAVVLTVAAWVFIDKATDRGLARLDHIERVYAVCQLDYAKARNSGDTARVDVQPLSAAIDSGKTGAPLRCGELRRRDALTEQDSVRRKQTNSGKMPTRDGR